MHEFSICQQLVESVENEVAAMHPRPNSVLRVRVVIGRMRQVVPETMELAFETLSRGTVSEGAALELVFEEIKARCPACDWEGNLEKKIFLCPHCDSKKIELLGGKELYLDQMEVEHDDEASGTDPGI